MQLLAIVVVCDLFLGRCNMMVSTSTFPDPATCRKVVEAGIREQLAQEGVTDAMDNRNKVTFGWCEDKDLPYAQK